MITLAYSLRGGLRSSLVTDAVQLAGLVFLMAVVGLAAFPTTGVRPLLTAGEWTWVGGEDLLFVALLQVFSYPFHDPVLTDRAFIAPVGRVKRAFGVAGAAGVVLILVSSAFGTVSFVTGTPVAEDAPRVLAAALGVGSLAAMNGLMMASAGSTLDSTFSALAKWGAIDLPALAGGWLGALRGSIGWGRVAMLAGALLGSLPLLTGATILQATTISGTMVIGLAPAIGLYRLRSATPVAFHLAFWSGIAIGVAFTLGLWPAALTIGDGSYSDLLGANLYGLAAVTALFLLASVPRGPRTRKTRGLRGGKSPVEPQTSPVRTSMSRGRTRLPGVGRGTSAHVSPIGSKRATRSAPGA